MTVQEMLKARVDSLDDVQAARLLGYADALATEQASASADMSSSSDEDERFDDDELTHAEPKMGFAPGSPLWNIVGICDDDGPTDVSTNKHTHFAEAYDRHLRG